MGQRLVSYDYLSNAQRSQRPYTIHTVNPTGGVQYCTSQ